MSEWSLQKFKSGSAQFEAAIEKMCSTCQTQASAFYSGEALAAASAELARKCGALRAEAGPSPSPPSSHEEL
uniref:Uncharacterized protein n=1 Tax=Chromera velia CCMP2878 TaxID=1169474 RepID=A0A0G4IDE7_9ALVE|eukprot:Cvel_13408.t1-p1 / transcript=Cvel_13408.t1 / gene=Cvel_13408 / organism=Chromera_velia_CCMP2878 / gene_product=hypothetical protein / transcript_product=hypothetical protein / location=Cvel_scaffold914:15906-16735(-) / protein_length=71 / sequence_SO=supercontig / SO=protein_coding / is_pseudo=false